MSEARAITNVIGNGVGSLVVAAWQKGLDKERLTEVLNNPDSVDVDDLLAKQSGEGEEKKEPVGAH